MAKARLLLLAAAALAPFAVPAAAHAASPNGFATGKAEAILGGQSRLAELLAAQGEAPRAVPLRPSSYGIRFPAASGDRRAASQAALSGRPDVFGSVALKVERTPLDDRWHRVKRSAVGGAAAAFARSLMGLNERDRIESINRYVNKRVRFFDDARQYRRADVWAAADDTLNRQRGDCEDYAIAKLQMLRAAGFADRDLYVVVLKDLVRRSDHAVTVVRSGQQMFVLDNGTDQILDSESVRDYRPILTFGFDGAWTHGYRVRSTTTEIADARAEPVPPAISTANQDGQRSRSASLLALSTGFSR